MVQASGRRLGQDHDHDGSGTGGDTLNPTSVSTESATVDGGKEVLGEDPSSQVSGYSFGDWRSPSADRPSSVLLSLFCETDGSTPSQIDLAVDQSGGTSEDYFFRVVKADKELGANASIQMSYSHPLPVGASYRIINDQDPNGSNNIIRHREVIR